MGEADGPRIQVSKNGPYLVRGHLPIQRQTIVTDERGESVEWRSGEHLGTRPTCSLCRCGSSDTKPFCDGSHKTTEFRPVPYKAEKTEKVFFCGCKHTGGQPMCDGTHKQYR